MTVNNVTPPVKSGTFKVAQTVSCSEGTWTFDLDYLTYTYQWRRCDAAGANCVSIANATSNTYLVTAADVGSTLRCRVTATEHTLPPDPAPGDELSWAPPTLSSPVVYTLTNANRQQIPNGAGRVTAPPLVGVGEIVEIESPGALGAGDRLGHLERPRDRGGSHIRHCHAVTTWLGVDSDTLEGRGGSSWYIPVTRTKMPPCLQVAATMNGGPGEALEYLTCLRGVPSLLLGEATETASPFA